MKQQCPSCGPKDSKKDNLRLMKDGTYHCFACDYDTRKSKELLPMQEQEEYIEPQFITDGQYRDIQGRGISAKTCELYNYTQADYHGQQVQISSWFQNGTIFAQKLRYPDKSFPWIGYQKELPLFGSHIDWDLTSPIVITEGQIDAMTLAEVFPKSSLGAVSINGGCKAAKEEIQRWVEYLDQFPKIIVWFDQDKPGQDAIKEVIPLLPLGKSFIVYKSAYHDANEALKANDVGAMMDALELAEEIIPEGIVFGDQIDFSKLLLPEPEGIPLPFKYINETLRGIKKGRLYLVAAGTGTGKTSFLKEISYFWMKKLPNIKIANIFLEEDQRYTLDSYIALDCNIPKYLIAENPSLVPGGIEVVAQRLLGKRSLAFFDHFGSLTSQKLIKQIEYLAKVKKFDIILLDHISIAVSGNVSSREGERKDIDILMTSLRTVIAETGVTVLAAVHLKQPEGDRGYEEGKPINLKALRGSGSLSQIPDVVISLERNQQHPTDKDKTLVRILKNRITGRVGPHDNLVFMDQIERLVDINDALHQPFLSLGGEQT